MFKKEFPRKIFYEEVGNEMLLALFNIYEEFNNYEKLDDINNFLINKNPNKPIFLFKKAILKFNQKIYYEAIHLLNDYLKKVNNDYEALIYLGRCKLNIHDYEQAILVFDKLLKIKIHPEVYRFRAICKLELLLIESAKEDLLIAIDLKDNESNFIFELFYGTNK